MTKDQVKVYIEQQVTALSDAKIRPLVYSINSELDVQRKNDAAKAELDKRNAESNDRISKLQQELGKAKQEVEDLSEKLSESTKTAVS